MATRTNTEWIVDLQASGPRQAHALTDLRAELTRATYFYLLRRATRLGGLDDAERRQLGEDIVQDAMVGVIRHLDTFRGESRFTTWANKFAMHAAASELRRVRWRNVSLDMPAPDRDDGELGQYLTAAGRTELERSAARGQVWHIVRHAVDKDLTARQREALVAVIIDDRPVVEVARDLETNKNALYKLVFDARKHLRRVLAGYNWSVADILDTFDTP